MGTGREKARVKDRYIAYLYCVCLLAAGGCSIWFSRFSEKSPMQLVETATLAHIYIYIDDVSTLPASSQRPVEFSNA